MGKTLRLVRVEKTQDGIIGVLTIDGVLLCPLYTLEHPDLCAPIGLYHVDLQYSPRFNKLLWELIDVPDRTEIKFHAGNTKKDTQGCILLGKDVQTVDGRRTVLYSGKALELFHSLLPGSGQHEFYIIDACG
jgi:hypothetical protein